MAKNPYINIYGGEVTEGGTDGDLISCDGSFFYPISMLFDISKPEPAETLQGENCIVKKFAFRTEPGWTYYNTWIYLTQPPQETYSNWKMNWNSSNVDDNGWKDSSSWGGQYRAERANVNKCFYLRLRYNGRKWDYDLDKFLDHMGHYQDTGIQIVSKIAPVGFER